MSAADLTTVACRDCGRSYDPVVGGLHGRCSECRDRNYAGSLAECSGDELLDALASAVRSNSYGSHDRQIQIIRAAVKMRMVAP